MAQKRKFSHEIHGIRGLALSLVVAFHLFGAGRVSGGVDVFLVISAYLITGSLNRSLQAGKLSLLTRYGRTFSSLLPPALLTIAATMAAGILVLPRTKWDGIFAEAAAAATFRENLYLADTGLSYGAAGTGASPFQHFWSLSMQGQFLIFWPLLAFLLILMLRALRPALRSAIFASITALMVVASFLYAIHLVNIDQAAAYYSLGARLWEFGLGSLVAFWGSAASRRPLFWAWGGWVGLALIISSGFVVDGGALFPGPWALWPVTGALLVLLASQSGGAPRVGLTQALSARPIRWLANLGYPLYLWHWPILVLYLEHVGIQQIGLIGAIGVLAFSLGLSILTQRFVSVPFTKWSRGRQLTKRGSISLVAVLAVMALGVAAVASLGLHLEQRRIERELEELANFEGDLGIVEQSDTDQDPEDDRPLVPPLSVAGKDTPSIFDLDCIQDWRDGPNFSEVLICPDNPGRDADTAQSSAAKPPRIVMSGGSHVTQWYPAFREIADAEGWELIVIDKDGCRLATTDVDNKRSEACETWNEHAIDVILAQDPDAVVTLGTVTSRPGGNPERTPPGQVEAWELFTSEGVPVLVMRDNPRFVESIPDCLFSAEDRAACDVERADIYAETSPLDELDLPDLVIPVDLSDFFCNATTCPTITRNIVMYRDYGHITETFAKALAPPLKAKLQASLPQLFTD